MLSEAVTLAALAAGMLQSASVQDVARIDRSAKVANAVRIAGPAPELDGKLDDPIWRDARFFSDFIQKEPVEGAEPTERTEIAFLYDGDALWVGARMYSDDPGSIQALMSRRDRGSQSQHIWISLDTYHDGRTAYSFGITASGVRMDWYHPTDREFNIDASWDPVWEGRARVDSVGWTAEMRIPFSQLRFNDLDQQVWGLNVNRWFPERFEDVFWIPVPKSETAWASRMGTLVGINGVEPSRRLELAPYVASDATLSSDVDVDDPFAERLDRAARVGADLKMGLGPNLTLDATINPDFGQVEADPAVVNLSAFEVFFRERRPFFTEGSQLLNGGGAGYFYSRRIGQGPRGSVDTDYADFPRTSTILGAAKLTGRTAGGLSVGALGAVTAREHARTFDIGSNTSGDTEVAPVTGYGVVRMQQEFGPAASTVGGILTGVLRDVAPGDPLATTYNRTAVTGGADMNLRLADGAYEVGASLGFSHVEGDAARILSLQESSARYFQRPDQDYLRVDSSRTSLTGLQSSLSVQKNSGRHWLWNAFFSYESPEFELNDVGRMSTTDDVGAFATLTYRNTEPGSLFQSWEVSLSSENLFNTQFDRKFGAIRSDATFTWRNFWRTDLTAWVDVRGQSTTLTRGGPSMKTPLSRVVIARLSNNFGASTSWNGRVYYGTTELDGLTYRLSGGLTFRPAPRWEISASPNYLRDIEPRQYVTELAGGPAATFGQRYVFAKIDRSTWLMRIRLNYTITPDLTLELYAEPFTASGRYTDHGELVASRDNALRTYGTDGTTIARESDGSFTVTDGSDMFTLDQLDFNIRSFRSNLVLRWEWRPGSTLFVVWQQDRSSFDTSGDLVRPLSLFDGLTESGDNFFAVKLTYWLPVR